MELKEKIEKLIIGLGMTSTSFADYIEVSRPIISHILSGRNKPSWEILQRILLKFPEIGQKWIMDGEDLNIEIVRQFAKSQDFSSNFSLFEPSRELNISNQTVHNNSTLNSQGPLINEKTKNSDDKKVVKILVFYADNTFTEFSPNS
jgi:DNA-binding XRE family transcriptional regulator